MRMQTSTAGQRLLGEWDSLFDTSTKNARYIYQFLNISGRNCFRKKKFGNRGDFLKLHKLDDCSKSKCTFRDLADWRSASFRGVGLEIWTAENFMFEGFPMYLITKILIVEFAVRCKCLAYGSDWWFHDYSPMQNKTSKTRGQADYSATDFIQMQSKFA